MTQILNIIQNIDKDYWEKFYKHNLAMEEIEDVDFPKMFNELHVSNEQKMEDAILGDGWSEAKCHKCFRKYDLLSCRYTSCNSICPYCHNEQ